MALDLDVICILGVPVTGIAVNAALSRQVVLRDDELMALAGPDHELAFAAVPNLAGDRVVEEAVPQAVQHEIFEMAEGLAHLSAVGPALKLGRLARQALCSSAFMSLMAAANARGRTLLPSP